MDKNGDAVPVFNIGQLFPFSVEQVGCHIYREASVDFAYISFGRPEPDAAQVGKGSGFHRQDQPPAVAVLAGLIASRLKRGSESLTG